MNRKTEEIGSPTEKMLHDLKEVVHDGEAMLRSGAQTLSDHGADARERLSAAIESAKDMAHRLQKQTINRAKATDRMIRENPYPTMGIAFGLGLLIGVLINRRNNS